MCLREADVGTTKVFFDVDKAEQQGYIGTNPKIWGEREYATLIEMLTHALCASRDKWDTWRWHPTMWSLNGLDKKPMEPAQKKALTALEYISANPSPLAAGALTQPIFDVRSILGMQGNASSRESSTKMSTAASCKDDGYIKTARGLLVRIMEDLPETSSAAEQPPPKKGRKETEDEEPEGKHTAANRRNKENAKKKKLEERLALEDDFVKLNVKGSS